MFTYEAMVPVFMKPYRHKPALQGATPTGYAYFVKFIGVSLIKRRPQR